MILSPSRQEFFNDLVVNALAAWPELECNEWLRPFWDLFSANSGWGCPHRHAHTKPGFPPRWPSTTALLCLHCHRSRRSFGRRQAAPEIQFVPFSAKPQPFPLRPGIGPVFSNPPTKERPIPLDKGCASRPRRTSCKACRIGPNLLSHPDCHCTPEILLLRRTLTSRLHLRPAIPHCSIRQECVVRSRKLWCANSLRTNIGYRRSPVGNDVTRTWQMSGHCRRRSRECLASKPQGKLPGSRGRMH